MAEAKAQKADEALQTGNYEVLKRRLDGLAEELSQRAGRLNDKRKATFGGTELTVIGNERIRTENNCVPADVVALGDHLLVGYNVFLGLRPEFELKDVFSLHRFAAGSDGGFDFAEIPWAEHNPGLFQSEAFQREFDELRKYYKDTRLIQIRKLEKLLAVFQVGTTHKDVKVLRWQLTPDGQASYIDNRGERDHVHPSSHSFAWQRTGREDQRRGRFPHVSIRDKVFVETLGGDLTIKVEDNTESGRGVYSEAVDDKNQSLDDGEILFAEVGTLIVLKIRPFRENAYRYLVFNTRAQSAVRIDAIGQACIALPEDQGILFPGGYYLQTGEYKLFDLDIADLEFERQIPSPNGEDVLYVFHHRERGHYLLFPYNLIRREVATPIACDGYSLFPDGRMVVLRHAAEPTRVHPVQVWKTPFFSAEFAARQKGDGSYLSKVGNADLVRGISEAFALVGRVRNPDASRQRYEDIVQHVSRMSDAFHWLGNRDAETLGEVLGQIRANVEQIIDEFEKVLALRKRAGEALAEAVAKQAELDKRTDYAHWKDIDRFMLGMSQLRSQRGHLISLREVRYIDLAALDALEKKTAELFDKVSKAAVVYLANNDALAPFGKKLDEVLATGNKAVKVADLEPTRKSIEELAKGLEVLSETIATLQVDDPTVRTQILEGLSETFAHMNRVRAELANRKRSLSEGEDTAEFAAQFRLFGQATGTALAMAETPEACDAGLSRLMVQLEELESRFSEHDGFIADLGKKREEIYEAFAGKKQALLDQKQKKIGNLVEAGKRILEGVQRRARAFKSEDELNAYFAADAMVLKLRQLGEQLLELGDSVKSDELGGRLKAARQEGLRGLRDKLELFEEGADIIKLGRHRFSVNTQSFDLTVVPRDGGLALHLTSTDFYEPIDDPIVNGSKAYWDQTLVSETAGVYRAEFLAASILLDAEAAGGVAALEALHAAERGPGAGGLLELVRKAAADRYSEGYERGLHDHDAAKILSALLDMRTTAGLLRYGPDARAIAALWWAHHSEDPEAERALRRARSLAILGGSTAPGSLASQSSASATLAGELDKLMHAAFDRMTMPISVGAIAEAARYLVVELGREPLRFTTSAEADQLYDRVRREHGRLEEELRALGGDHDGQLHLALAWVDALVAVDPARFTPHRMETAVLCLTSGLARETSQARVHTTVEGLLGQHGRVKDQKLEVRLDELLARIDHFRRERVPGFIAFRGQLAGLVERRKRELRIDEVKPRVLSSFVRNQLLSEVYLPLIGANLAKQIGAAGDAKRTDLMGLLLLISPPGYGKTTLMEYVASRLGLVFVKVNGPALGHDVKSLDPAEAPNATARQEIDKLNFALEMGNNVMLLIDDIQHTHPEFLQKFISLCDGQRKIEGVWRGRTRTYDMRGRKFAVVMAGNPYTESGEAFKIPDMLANRADIYNLGDILDGKKEAFSLSYLENSLTSSPVLAPLATRDPADILKIIRMAKGEPVATTDLAHGYSAAELTEILSVFKHLFRCQEVLLAVNLQYIASAATADAYRTEPPFKLQGSYRNMNKLAEKVVAALTPDELERLLDDHYQGEAQTLTTGAESNLLKLREMRGRLTPVEKDRWAAIKSEYVRRNQLGGKEDDPATRVTAQLSLVGRELGQIREALLQSAEAFGEREVATHDDLMATTLGQLGKAIVALQSTLAKPLATAPSDPPTLPGARPRRQVASGPVPQGEGNELAAVLSRLAQVLAQPPRDVTVHLDTPTPDFAGFFEHQNEVLREALIPVARAATKNLDETTMLTRKLLALLGQAQQSIIGGPNSDDA